VNKKTFGEYTLNRKLKITHDVLPLKLKPWHAHSSLYCFVHVFNYCKLFHSLSQPSSNICDNLLLKAIGLQLMFTQCENWLHFIYRCAFPLHYFYVRTHGRMNVPRIYFTETAWKVF
jgi:hypothetical protein